MSNYLAKYKFIFYLFNLILILLYLFPGSLLGCVLYNDCKLQPQITPDFFISSNHFYAFILLSVLGFFTFIKPNQIFYLSIYLILLSLILEIMHLFIPERSFEYPDLFGNFIGVIVVVIFRYLLKKV
tara:strand:+ start:377 stop:757 length:381 start_codon:yes stop_codon:yes gene_type:complete